ncbi:hypothetical protein F4802DRAFT_95860 [Xylaria palmicola]|nr:hypothetical protein F4802DRAFT_95860 [Xylaria palmicola]
MSVTLKQVCCNDSSTPPCTRPGSLTCQKCRMIVYCRKECQKAHWATHRGDCNSPYTKQTWQPRWIAENRIPAFIGGPPHRLFGTLKYLWGNVPAIDVAQLAQNEGVNFQGPIRMLFPASGDMRNAIFSVASLPLGYRGPLNIVLNDNEIDIVARNVIFLLIFFLEDNPAVAAECVTQVWYSALITEACKSMLRVKIKPLIEEMCNTSADEPLATTVSKRWQFGVSSLQLVLTRQNWISLLRYLETPLGFTKDDAQRVRQAVTSAPERTDYVDKALCTMSNSARMGMMKFREDGILLPFGQSRESFTYPNPTMFRSQSEWPMMDSADPTASWPMKSFLQFNAGPATNDAYGKLYFYLRDLFVKFHHRLRSLPVTFKLLHLDARALPTTLAGNRFDRIDVGNLCDLAYLGTETTLQIFGPLLQPLSINPYATLITLFLNAVSDAMLIMKTGPPPAVFALMFDQLNTLTKVFRFMPKLRRQNTSPTLDIKGVKMLCATSLAHDMDMYFHFYMEVLQLQRKAFRDGLRMKPVHTIIDMWPWRMPQGQPTQETKRDFALLLSSTHTGQERFVEWKLTPEGPVQGSCCCCS